MFPWIDVEDLYQFRRNFKLPEYGLWNDSFKKRTPDDLERLFEMERRVTSFFTDSLKEEVISLQERQKNAVKVLNKMKKVSNHSGK